MKLLSWRRYSQFWYAGYALQGIVVFGTGAIIMPIVVNNAGDAAKAEGTREKAGSLPSGC